MRDFYSGEKGVFPDDRKKSSSVLGGVSAAGGSAVWKEIPFSG